jgi:hypothetical protein
MGAIMTERGRLVHGSVSLEDMRIMGLVTLAAALSQGCADPGENCTRHARPEEGGDPVVAAQLFLDSLGYEKYDAATFRFDDTDRKSKWSNLPDGVLLGGRNGLRIGDMSEEQCDAALALMFAAVPVASSQQVLDVMHADDFLAEHNQPNPIRWTSDNYYFSIFGTPSHDPDEPWMLQMNGHHTAMNVTFVGDNVTRAPDFLGVEPLTFTIGTEVISPMDDERRVGLDAANALIDVDGAKIEHPSAGILLGAGEDGKFPDVPEGVALGTLNEAQRQLVRDVVILYLRRVPEPSRSQWLADFDASIDDAHFAWAGDLTDASLDAYYRVHSPVIWIELSFEAAIGNDGNPDDEVKPHFHSVFRDPRNDYGAAWL